MEMFDLVIRGGTVVTAADTAQADVGIRGGIIAAVGLDLPSGRAEIDAAGLLVMPGGINSHVHLAQPSGDGPVMADGFETGSRSAIAGGQYDGGALCFAGAGHILAPGGCGLP